MGHLVMQRAADTAIALAKENGVAWVGARRSNHAGAAGTYAAMALPHDMIGIYSAVANANHMPAWGAAESLLSTNPIAIAVPAGDEPPVVLDIATTVVSYGTVKAYKLQNKPMPEGWMVSAKDGKPITDSAKSGEGLLMPIGGHKGSGLALVLGLLAGVLNGAAFGREVVDFNADDESACNTGHFIIALDVSRFLPIAAFKSADRPATSRSEGVAGAAGLQFHPPARRAAPGRAAPTAREWRAGVPRGGRAARQAAASWRSTAATAHICEEGARAEARAERIGGYSAQVDPTRPLTLASTLRGGSRARQFLTSSVRHFGAMASRTRATVSAGVW